MKIRIITIHGIPNFGSVFQSYGLCKYLIDNGYTDTKVIDYNPGYYKNKSLISTVGRVLNYKSYITRTKKFRTFLEENLPMTAERFKTFEELKNHNFDADVYIAGGDQLWNVFYACGNDDAYKLTFVNGKKISNETRMRQKAFQREQLEELGEKLKVFSAVSVREPSTVSLLESVNIKATWCVDPVFLPDVSDYDKFIKPINEPDYMMVYLVTPSKLLEDCIKYLSQKYNLKVILCSGFSKKCTCDKFIKDLGPDEMLSYIKNAKIVLSSSFHATAFSLIFQKQFFTILPGEHTNELITDLLEMRDLSNRIITDETLLEKTLDSVIDYSKTNNYSEHIKKSQEYLQRALSDD